MTTLTLTIGGNNFLPQYKTGSARITAQIQNQGDSCSMVIVQKTGQSAPTVGQELIFKDGSRFLFGGFVTKVRPTEYGVGQLIEYDLEASDYTYLLVNKYGQARYDGQTLTYIVNDLLTQSMDAGYGLSASGVSTGPTVATIAFNHIPLRQCFENLAKLTGYIWWVGYDKVIHFIDPASAPLSPELITDALQNHESMAITVDSTQVRNDIVILGGVTESSSYQQVIVGDGFAREWVLVYPVTTMTSIELDTGGGYVTKVFGVDPKDSETGNDFMYSPDRGSIRCTGTTTTPALTTTKIRVTFTYPLNVTTEVQSATSIIAMKAIEGGDGVHSYTINDSTILSLTQATQRALKELDQFANPILSGEFVTRTGLLQAGSYFAPGQALTVNLPSWGIGSNTTYIIQRVITEMQESGSAIEYTYTVTFGGFLLGVVNFLQALASPEEPLDSSNEVTKIHALAEVVSVAEVITRNSNVKSVAETVTVAESITRTNVTPPWKYAPSGTKQARWNNSEWG